MKYFHLHKQADSPYYRQKIRSLPKNEENKQRLELFNYIKRMPQATVRVFHGTSTNIWKYIQRDGYFTSPNMRGAADRERRISGLDEVFFTTSLPYANYYAQRSAKQDKSEPIMIVLEIPIYYFIEVSSIILGEHTTNIYNEMDIQFRINDIITKEDTIDQKAQAVVTYVKNWMQNIGGNEFTVKHALPLKFIKSVFNLASQQNVEAGNVRRQENFENIRSSLPYFKDKSYLAIWLIGNPTDVSILPEMYRNDKQFMLDVVTENWEALQFASQQVRNDKNVVFATVKQNGNAFLWASDELKNDEDIVFAVLKFDVHLLVHASKQLLNDEKFMLRAAKRDEYALRYASVELKNDKKFMLKAVKQDSYALFYASEQLKNDREIVLEAVKQNCHTLQLASEQLKNDTEVVLEAVKQNGKALQYASEQFRNDKQSMLEVVKQNGSALDYASQQIQNDPDILAIVNQKKSIARGWYRRIKLSFARK